MAWDFFGLMVITALVLLAVGLTGKLLFT